MNNPEANLKRVAIESPYRGNEVENSIFCRNICRYAILNGYNPYAMHIFYTQFLDDGKPHERELGISCGLQWTDFADEIWFCLRRTDSPSSGMLRAIERNQQLIKSGRMRVLKFLYFTQEGQPAGEWKPTQF